MHAILVGGLTMFLAEVGAKSELATTTPATGLSEAVRAPDEAISPAGQDIVVTGARTRLPATALPLTVDVLGGEDFQRQVSTSGSVIEALSARLPSFSPAREKLSGAGETLRGRSPLFAINSVPQSTPIRDGSRDGYTIDPFFIDRVEVIYGSNALQGIGATGGVINQVTIGAPAQPGVSARTLVQGTTQDGFDGSALGAKGAASIAWRDRGLEFVAGAARERRGVFLDGAGERIGFDSTQGELQDSDSWSLFGKVGVALSGTARLEVVANRFELEGRGNYLVAAGLPTTSIKGRLPGEAPSNRAELLSASFTEQDLAGGILTAQAFFSRTRDIFGGSIAGTFQDVRIAPIGTLFDQSVNKSRKLGSKLTYERAVPGIENLVLVGGLDILHDRTAQTLLATDRTWVPETSFFSVAPFLQSNLRLLDGKLRLVGGARRESVRLKVPDFTTLAFYGSRNIAGGEPKFDRTLFNGGIVVEPIRSLRAYASYAEGYTIADVGRILRAINVNGVDVDNYLALEPVVSNNRELGLEWNRGPVSASFTYWWSSSKLGSLLVRNADGIFDVARQPIRLRGLDLSLKGKLPIEGLSIGAAYSKVDGRSDANGDGRIQEDLDGANIAPDRLNLFAAYESGRLDARVTSRVHFARTFDDTPTATDFEGYTLIDAQAGLTFDRNRISLSVSNLFDKTYLSYNSDTVGAGDPLRSFRGRGRTITLGLASRF